MSSARGHLLIVDDVLANLEQTGDIERTMRLADNSHHRFKRWFDKEA